MGQHHQCEPRLAAVEAEQPRERDELVSAADLGAHDYPHTIVLDAKQFLEGNRQGIGQDAVAQHGDAIGHDDRAKALQCNSLN